MFGAIDFSHLLASLTEAVGPLCVMFAPTVAIERKLFAGLRAQEAARIAAQAQNSGTEI